MSRGRHAQPPLRLTRRGRIVRDVVIGALVLALPLFATQLSVAFFTVVVWAGQFAGLTA
ncbi:hypothetical protein SAMN05660199_00180 [Klenkia soli]|uniref:Uncharacterized protein n=1 Tax=Klenkia soli TaxID=1052260 RepID=A0A1H0C1K4_9ACTN|nr:hypothetical protein [Klenkia soli]SDN51784.1 hypothetical protein SAMN05660199_00180 [Klenkia soli]